MNIERNGKGMYLNNRMYIRYFKRQAQIAKEKYYDFEEFFEELHMAAYKEHLIPHRKGKKRHYPRKTKCGKYQKYK